MIRLCPPRNVTGQVTPLHKTTQNCSPRCQGRKGHSEFGFIANIGKAVDRKKKCLY